MLRQHHSGDGRITGAQRLMDGGSIPPSSTIFGGMVRDFRRHGSAPHTPDTLETVNVNRCVLVATAMITGILTACGNSAAAPTSCPTDEVLPTMNRYVEGSVFIDTPWEPAPDTDLAAAINAGGVACAYGVQEAEVGAAILWTPSKDAFADRRVQWQIDGHRKVEVAGADEAWALEETNGEEQHLWALNLLVDDVWISINATFLRDLSQAQPLVDVAMSVTS